MQDRSLACPWLSLPFKLLSGTLSNKFLDIVWDASVIRTYQLVRYNEFPPPAATPELQLSPAHLLARWACLKWHKTKDLHLSESCPEDPHWALSITRLTKLTASKRSASKLPFFVVISQKCTFLGYDLILLGRYLSVGSQLWNKIKFKYKIDQLPAYS